MSLNGLSLVTRARQLADDLGDTLGKTGAKSLARQLRTHGAKAREVGRDMAALDPDMAAEAAKAAEEIERAAAPLKAYLADEPNPAIDYLLKRRLQELFGGTYGGTQLRVNVADVQRAGRRHVAFRLEVYRTDKGAYGHPNRKRVVGSMSARIRDSRGGGLIALHDDIYLDPSVRGVGGLNELFGRLKWLYRELGVRDIEHRPTDPTDRAWTRYRL